MARKKYVTEAMRYKYVCTNLFHRFLKSFKRAQFDRNLKRCASWSAKELAKEIAFVLHAK